MSRLRLRILSVATATGVFTASFVAALLVATSFMPGAAIAQVPGWVTDSVSIEPFRDSAHHWYDITDEEHVITPVAGQLRYAKGQMKEIADNILLYQKKNGGWPKNYDMQAILTPQQQEVLRKHVDDNQTTFDNGATHAQVDFLARAYRATLEEKYRRACVRGIKFILQAQYPNGGWPQFYPDTSGYRRYVTFNDGAMMGVMGVLRHIAAGAAEYAWLDESLRVRARSAYEKGLACILACQIREGRELTGWCQQHDDRTLKPRPARSFEPAAATGMESAEVVRFLMEIENPSGEIIAGVQVAVDWFFRSRITGIRAEFVRAPNARYRFHAADFDRVVISDPDAPPLWARYYELGTNVPLFCNRDGKPVYTLGEVDRERRTGYAWYTEEPAFVIARYPAWQKRWDPARNVLAADTLLQARTVPRDTSFTTQNAWSRLLKQYPHAKPATFAGSGKVRLQKNLVYAAHGYRHLSLDICSPVDTAGSPYPVVMLIHGGGWRSGDRSHELPMAEALAERGYAAVAVEYRLSAEASYPAGLHDLKTAIRWIRAHAAEYGLHPDRIAVMGGSAGGTLAGLLGTTAGLPEFDGKGAYPARSTAVRAIVDMDGVLDFADSAESGKDTDPARPSAGKLWFGASFRDNPDIWRQASPVRWVSSQTPPLLVINSSVPRFRGGRDEMISRLREFGIPAEVYEFPDAPHPFWLMHPWVDTVRDKVAAFLDRHLKGA